MTSWARFFEKKEAKSGQQDEVRAAGYHGSLTQLKLFVRRVRLMLPRLPAARNRR